VLLERAGRRAGQLVGRSPYMQSVHVTLPPVAIPRLVGKMLQVRIEAAHPNSLSGRPTLDGEDLDGAPQMPPRASSSARITA
jgi:tRNA-2-methylthio-N6-dimethylallyladenosine synthase